MPTKCGAHERHELSNRTAAELIRGAPEKHGGAGSLQVQWARAVLAKTEGEPRTRPNSRHLTPTK